MCKKLLGLCLLCFGAGMLIVLIVPTKLWLFSILVICLGAFLFTTKK